MVAMILIGFGVALNAQVVEVQPVFPKVHDDVTITFNAAEGNGALLGVSPDMLMLAHHFREQYSR